MIGASQLGWDSIAHQKRRVALPHPATTRLQIRRTLRAVGEHPVEPVDSRDRFIRKHGTPSTAFCLVDHIHSLRHDSGSVHDTKPTTLPEGLQGGREHAKLLMDVGEDVAPARLRGLSAACSRYREGGTPCRTYPVSLLSFSVRQFSGYQLAARFAGRRPLRQSQDPHLRRACSPRLLRGGGS